MPITNADISLRLSGGAANAVPAASLGGAKSSVAMVSSTIFDTVTGAESAAGDVEYRLVYAHNEHATLTMYGAVAWLQANTPSATTTLDIALGNAAVNATEPAVADESTAPSGPAFVPAATLGAGIALGDIPPGQHRAIWIRRTVAAGSSASADTATLRVTCDTEA